MRGEIYDARLDPVEGSEQAGTRPVIIVSRNAINAGSTVILAVPCTTYRSTRRQYPSHVILQAPNGGLTADSVALCEQARALAISRLLRLRGTLTLHAMIQIDRGLAIAFDLPGQSSME